MSRFIPVEPDKWAEMVNALAENDRLKAQNARLRLAGDALELFITFAGFTFGARSGLIRAWNAAKEGKPHP
jgi:hypothetical protein